MPCKAEKQALAEIRRRQLRASESFQLETAAAELNILRSNERIYDWSMVRLAEAVARCWDVRCALAEEALARCTEREKQRESARRD